MEFCLLGPVEVRRASRAVPIGASRQRAVLASLLLRVGQVVPVGALIDDLWGDRPPPTARTTVRNYIRRLRLRLPEPVLVTEPPGYELRIDADRLDLQRFQRSVATARHPGTDPRRAATALREALRLWRGRALSNIGDVPIWQIEARRLEEMRLLALEDCLDAELRLGLHRQVIPELRALVAEQPMRERPRELLMLAMYRCGWRQEALAFYQETRSALIDAIGLEPGQPLQRLHRGILVGDPALECPALAGVGS